MKNLLRITFMFAVVFTATTAFAQNANANYSSANTVRTIDRDDNDCGNFGLLGLLGLAGLYPLIRRKTNTVAENVSDTVTGRY